MTYYRGGHRGQRGSQDIGRNRGQNSKAPFYEPYWTEYEVREGLKRDLVEGTIKVINDYTAFVLPAVSDGSKDILIDRQKDRNRALNSDEVVVQLHSRDQWQICVEDFEKYEKTISASNMSGTRNTSGNDGARPEPSNVATEASKSPGKSRFMSVSDMQENGSPLVKKLLREWMKDQASEDVNNLIKPKGKVVYIKKKNHPRCAVGHISLMENNNRHAVFKPRDKRIPFITIELSKCPRGFAARPEQFANTLFIAHIQDWKQQFRMPDGYLGKDLGEKGQIEPEIDAILFEMSIDKTQFSTKVLQSLPREVPQSELSCRRDLRRYCVFTIDGPVTKDLDDAVSVEKLHNGDYEVGVHIADVSFFVKEGTELDKAASQRATSVYFDEKEDVIPMLPQLLCEDLCSLKPGCDRLAFSVMLIIDEQGKVKSEWLGRTAIRSCVRLSYDEAQDLIHQPNKDWTRGKVPQTENPFNIKDVIDRLLWLNKITAKLEEQRLANGTLVLEKSYVQYIFDSNKRYPESFSVIEFKDSDRIIEELMVLANRTVARKIIEKFPDKAVLQQQPPPDPQKLKALKELCESLGYEVNLAKSCDLQNFLSECSREGVNSKERKQVLGALISRQMIKSKYICSATISDKSLQGHFCLNEPVYTHFTSPIRRYTDIMVHRQLAAALGYSKLQEKSTEELQKQLDDCNEKDNAKKVSKQCYELYLGFLVEKARCLEEPGMVMAVQEKFFEVLIFRPRISRRIYIDDLKLESVSFRVNGRLPELIIEWAADKMCKRKTKHKISIFTEVDCLISAGKEPLEVSCTIKRPKKEI